MSAIHATPGDRRTRRPRAPALAALTLLLAGLAGLAWRQEATVAVPSPPIAAQALAVPQVPSPPVTVPTGTAPLPATAQERPAPPPAPARVAPPPVADFPYRYLGQVTEAGVPALVLYGRGRTVTLQAPGPIDEAYALDAIFDGYVVVRHVPSGAARFLPLAVRQQAAPRPASPDASPQD